MKLNLPLPDIDDDDTKDYLICNENAQWNVRGLNNENNNRENSFYSFNTEKSLSNNAFPEIPLLYLHHSFPYIHPETVIQLMRNQIKLQNYPEGVRLVFIDCRFAYEYNAGHIKNAYNLLTFDDLVSIFNTERNNNAILIFHCELTVDRSVKWSYIFRNYDRYCSGLPFPQLAFPNVFLLKGGFRGLYRYLVSLTNNTYSIRPFTQITTCSDLSSVNSNDFQSQEVKIDVESPFSDIICGEYLTKDDGFRVLGDEAVKESQSLYTSQIQRATLFLNAQCAPMLPNACLYNNRPVSNENF